MVLLLSLLACGPDWTARTLLSGGEGSPVAALPEDVPGEAAETSPLALNELMAANDSVLMDEQLDRDDWLELYNRSDETVSLEGWTLSEGGDAEGWSLPEDRELGPGERLLVWLDGEPEEGALHADLSVDEDEGELHLWHEGEEMESLSWEELGADVVLGRFPDGSATLAPSARPTPYNPNPADPGQDLDPSDALFPQDDVLELELWIPSASLSALASSPYEYVEASLGFEGVWLDAVGVRIKGQAGSLRTLDAKAALKVKLDAYEDGTRLRGLESLTLNNMVQDPSCVHERTAYALFRDAGVPAPRTGLVALYINGEYRGIYNHVETIDDRFLARWFEDPEGNLYEGAYGEDLTTGSYTGLELDQDGDEDVEPYTELAAVAEIVAQPPTEANADALEALVDLDGMFALWAVEVLTGHWDGYFYYPNNYRVYHDPSTGLLSMIPWGTDQTFGWTGEIDAPAGDLAIWCLQVPSLEHRFKLALWDAADRARRIGLDAEATEAWALAEPWLEADPYKEYSVETGQYYYEYTLSLLESWPEAVVGELFPDGEPILGN